MKFYTLEEANANIDLLQKTFGHLGTLYDWIGDHNDPSLTLADHIVYTVKWASEHRRG